MNRPLTTSVDGRLKDPSNSKNRPGLNNQTIRIGMTGSNYQVNGDDIAKGETNQVIHLGRGINWLYRNSCFIRFPPLGNCASASQLTAKPFVRDETHSPDLLFRLYGGCFFKNFQQS